MKEEDLKRYSEDVERRFIRWREINRWVDRILLSILLLISLLAGAVLIDSLRFDDQELPEEARCNFDALTAINPDTVAWLTLTGTEIDYPVVQGTDNFEYLDTAFTGEYSAGGAIFLDCGNAKDFSDSYNIIHGHHMSGGAMFGSLGNYLEEDFLESHRTGVLMSPRYDWDLEVLQAGIYDAYDGSIYCPGEDAPDFLDAVQVLALSTCSGEMNDDRIVVFCSMKNRRAHGTGRTDAEH